MNLNFDPELIGQGLEIMAFGMAGIFVVAIILFVVVYTIIFTYVFSSVS